MAERPADPRESASLRPEAPEKQESASAEALQRGVQWLRAGRWGRAQESIEEALRSGLSPQLQGRAWSLLAQARLQVGELGSARVAVQRALAIARAEGDRAGIEAVQSLQQRIESVLAIRAAEKQGWETGQRSLRALLEGVEEPLSRIRILVQRANASVDEGRPAMGSFLAWRALEQARSVRAAREEILALLCWLRASPHHREQLISWAHRAADRSNEPALIEMVARASRAAGVDLDPFIFGSD